MLGIWYVGVSPISYNIQRVFGQDRGNDGASVLLTKSGLPVTEQIMDDFIDLLLRERRSLRKTLDDLLETYERRPSPERAKTIKLLREEIERLERATQS